jgi:hypothetical protein
MPAKKQSEPKPKASKNPPAPSLTNIETVPIPEQQLDAVAVLQRSIQAPRAMSPRYMLRLQRTVGNAAVSQMLRGKPAPSPRSPSTAIQTELTAEQKAANVEKAKLTWGTFSDVEPDYANPALKDTPADSHKMTVAVSKEDLNWDSKFDQLLKHYTKYPLMGPALVFKKVRQKYEKKLNNLKKGINNVGHAWVRLSSYVKDELKELYSFGFYPQKFYDPETEDYQGGYLGFTKAGPGQVRHPDIYHEGDPGKRYYDHKTSQSGYSKAMKLARERMQSPPQYILTSYNCTTFAREVMKRSGGQFPGRGVLPGHIYTPGYLYSALTKSKKAYGYGTQEKSDDKKDDPLAGIIKQVTDETGKRGLESRKQLLKDFKEQEAKKKIFPALISVGFVTEDEVEKLPLIDVRVFFAFRTFQNQGPELLGEKKGAIHRAAVFQRLEQAFKAATQEIYKVVEEGDSMPPPITLSLMGQLSAAGLTRLAKFLNLSEKELLRLRDNLGVTRAVKGGSGARGHKEKTELGHKLKLGEEVLPQLTYTDVVAYSRFRRFFQKGVGKKLTEDMIIKAHKKAKLGKFMEYLSKITEAGLMQLADYLGLDKSDLEYLLYKVRLKFKVTPSQRYFITGTKQNKVTVYAEKSFKRVGDIAGSTKVTALDPIISDGDFIRIRYKPAWNKPDKGGRVLGAHLVKTPQRPKRNALAKIFKRKPPLPPKKQTAIPVPALEPIMGYRELVSKAGLHPSDSELYQKILRYTETWPIWKQSSPGHQWLYSTLTNFRKLITDWQQTYQSKSKKPRQEAIASLGAQVDQTQQMLVARMTGKQLISAAQLERHDPQHRKADILVYCKERWLKTEDGKKWDPDAQPPPPEFYTFVDTLEKTNDPGLEDRVKKYLKGHLWSRDKDAEEKAIRWIETRKAKNQPVIPRIQYLQAEDREQYRLKFNGYNVSNASGPLNVDLIYVMTPGMEFFGKPENKTTQMEFHHSSFLAGAEVGAAGHMMPASNGIIINLESGHYHPTPQHMVNALYGLKRKGVPLEDIIARPVVGQKRQQTMGDGFLALIRAVKAITEDMLDDLIFADTKTVLQELKPFGLTSILSAKRMVGFLEEFRERSRSWLKNLKNLRL